MKKVQLFYQPGCPYCRAALKWIDETRKEKPETADLPIEMIDEIEHTALADTYDYSLRPDVLCG
jgi:glutaredoxin